MPKPESNPPTPEQQAQADKQAVITALRKVITDPKSKVLDKTRAADTLGHIAEYSWFAKPHDASQQDTSIDPRTAARLADLAERLLGPCPHCGGKL